MDNAIAGRCVLVTGAGGTIGGEIVRQLWAYHPAEVVLLGHGENSIYARLTEAQEAGHDPIPVIADIRDSNRIRAILDLYRPDIVFHAAAHKHVPLMEVNPVEAVSNNVLGTEVLVDACRSQGIERFVLVSTDKAVNPTSVMGATKRVAELIALHARYSAIRLGNVYGSRGSVIDLFTRQIRAGGPVTITDPAMTRYMMNEGEAGQLAIHAAMLEGSGIYLREMGPARSIMDLAEGLIALFGKPEQNIQIVTTGPRPGEKLHEALTMDGELLRQTCIPIVEVVRNSPQPEPVRLSSAIAALETAVETNNLRAIVRTIQRIVPEYEPSNYVKGLIE